MSRRLASAASAPVRYCTTPALGISFPSCSIWRRHLGETHRRCTPRAIETDENGLHHCRRCHKPAAENSVKLAVGGAAIKRIRRAVKYGDMHEPQTVIESERLVVHSPRVPHGKLSQHVLDQ